MGTGLIIIIVPGRDDRAFYKRLILKYFGGTKKGITVKDIDAGPEARQAIERVLPLYKGGGPHYLVKGSVVIRLTRGRKALYTAIIPSEERPERRACSILMHLSGKEPDRWKQFLRGFIIIDDAEERTFAGRLLSFIDSLTAMKCVHIKEKVSEGTYFTEYVLKKPAGLKLVLMVQGLAEISFLPKHTIEDFAVYLYARRNEEKARLTALYEELVKAAGVNEHGGRERKKHKKIANLIALSKCYLSTEELFSKGLTEADARLIVEAHDGLRKLVRMIENSL